MLQWKRSRSVFILLSVIFSVAVETVSFSVYIIIGYIQCCSGNGLVQCSVYIITGYILCYSGNGLVQCSVYIITGYILCYSETVSFSAVLGALKRAVGVSLQRRV